VGGGRRREWRGARTRRLAGRKQGKAEARRFRADRGAPQFCAFALSLRIDEREGSGCSFLSPVSVGGLGEAPPVPASLGPRGLTRVVAREIGGPELGHLDARRGADRNALQQLATKPPASSPQSGTSPQRPTATLEMTVASTTPSETFYASSEVAARSPKPGPAKREPKPKEEDVLPPLPVVELEPGIKEDELTEGPGSSWELVVSRFMLRLWGGWGSTWAGSSEGAVGGASLVGGCEVRGEGRG